MARGWWSTKPLRAKGLLVALVPALPIILLWVLIGWAVIRQVTSGPSPAVRTRESQAILMRARALYAEERAAKMLGQQELTPDTDALAQLATLRGPIADAEGLAKVEALIRTIEQDRLQVDKLFVAGINASPDLRQQEAKAYAAVRDAFVDLRESRDVWLANETLNQSLSRAISLGFLALTVIGVLGGFWFAVTLSRSISSRIERVVLDADAVARGEDVNPADLGADEIGALGRRLHTIHLALRQREQLAERRAKELAGLNQELEAFSYSVSHDLRAPLRAISGFSQIIEEDQADRLDQSGRDALGRIKAATDRMSLLIDQLLTLSRLSRAAVTLQVVDVSALAAAVVDDLRRESPHRQVHVEITPGLTVQADAALLRIVLDNLVGNAWKYTSRTDDASIAVTGTATADEDLVEIRDNGAGFDMAHARMLFGAFQRLHSIREFEGTGVGLATVQRIIHRHGGRVWAHGEVGKGATFTVALPRAGEITDHERASI